MRTKIFCLIATSLVMLTGELQADIIFDNQAAGQTVVSFSGGTGFPQSRTVVGDDFDSIATPNEGETYRVDSIDYSFLAFFDATQSSFEDVTVEVSLVDLGSISVRNSAVNNNGNYTSGDFANATVLGSEVFSIADFTVGATTAFANSVTFTNGIDIGDGVGTGVSFRFSDSTGGTELGLLTVGYRNSFTTAAPSVGVTSDRNYRDGGNNGTINSAFGFASDIGLAYTVNATAISAVPEPTSIAILGLFGLAMFARRRR